MQSRTQSGDLRKNAAVQADGLFLFQTGYSRLTGYSQVFGSFAGGRAEGAAKSGTEVKSLMKEADRKMRIAGAAADKGNASSAARRISQADALKGKAEGIIQRRAVAASTAAAQLGSKIAKSGAKKKEEGGSDQ
jgi:hypothetical protein